MILRSFPKSPAFQQDVVSAEPSVAQDGVPSLVGNAGEAPGFPVVDVGIAAAISLAAPGKVSALGSLGEEPAVVSLIAAMGL